MGDHGYNLSRTTVRKRYTELGQLFGAVGWATGESNVKVVKDGRVSVTELENQRTETLTKNVYEVVRGQAVSMSGGTQSWTAGSDGKRIGDVG